MCGEVLQRFKVGSQWQHGSDIRSQLYIIAKPIQIAVQIPCYFSSVKLRLAHFKNSVNCFFNTSVSVVFLGTLYFNAGGRSHLMSQKGLNVFFNTSNAQEVDERKLM